MGTVIRDTNHVNMAEEEETVAPVDVDHEDDPNYQPPPEKSIDDMLQADKDDESLVKYKAALLGGAVAGSGAIVVEPDDPRTVIVQREIVHGLKYVQKTYRFAQFSLKIIINFNII